MDFFPAAEIKSLCLGPFHLLLWKWHCSSGKISPKRWSASIAMKRGGQLEWSTWKMRRSKGCPSQGAHCKATLCTKPDQVFVCLLPITHVNSHACRTPISLRPVFLNQGGGFVVFFLGTFPTFPNFPEYSPKFQKKWKNYFEISGISYCCDCRIPPPWLTQPRP